MFRLVASIIALSLALPSAGLCRDDLSAQGHGHGRHPKTRGGCANGCATRGLASAALMQNDLDVAAKMLWTAVDLLPREERAAYGAAIKHLQIIGTK